MPTPCSPLVLCIAACWALVIAFRGVPALPLIVAYVVPHGAMVLFQALLASSTSLPGLTVMAVLIGVAVVTLIAALMPATVEHGSAT